METCILANQEEIDEREEGLSGLEKQTSGGKLDTWILPSNLLQFIQLYQLTQASVGQPTHERTTQKSMPSHINNNTTQTLPLPLPPYPRVPNKMPSKINRQNNERERQVKTSQHDDRTIRQGNMMTHGSCYYIALKKENSGAPLNVPPATKTKKLASYFTSDFLWKKHLLLQGLLRPPIRI